MSQPVELPKTTVTQTEQPLTDERPVHSIEDEPKTGSKKGRLVSIILIAILIIIGIIFLVVGFNLKSSFNQCVNDENPSCLSFTCSGNQTATCGADAYRCSKKGYVRCSSNPYTDVAIAEGDGDLCNNSG